MATDFAVVLFLIPVLIGLAVVAVVALTAKPATDPNAFLGLGARRVAVGFLGAMAALLAYSVIDSIVLGFSKVALGHVTADEMPSMVPGWSIYLFVLLAPFVALSLGVIGLPSLALLRRAHLASIAGVLLVAVAIAGLRGWITYEMPYNIWCGSHLAECTKNSFVESMVFAVVIALGFGAGARLPLIRSESAL